MQRAKPYKILKRKRLDIPVNKLYNVSRKDNVIQTVNVIKVVTIRNKNRRAS